MKHYLFVCAAALSFAVSGLASPPAWAQAAEAETSEGEGLPSVGAQILEDATASGELTEEDIAELKAMTEEADAFNATLTPQYGSIKLFATGTSMTDPAGVTLDLGDDYYFLNRQDSKRVLEDLWGNPPGMDVLGMIFAKGTDPYFNEYSVAVTYDPSGYVSDKKAAKMNYDKLLRQMQSDTRAANTQRIAMGYGSAELVGWALPPKYDAENHRLYWAKTLKFEGTEGNTLNYNLRFLGRRGVLEFNYIANEEALEGVSAALPEMAKIAQFNEGHRYDDFDKSTDKAAAYGVAGLIAGGAVAKKAGLLGILLLFFKKGFVFIIAGVAIGWRFLAGFFDRRNSKKM